MPTLSPQPAPTHANTAPPLTPSQGPKSISSACNNQVHSPVPGPTLKRPILASREYEGALLEDEHPLAWLYDYSTQEAWLDHPVKRLKVTISNRINVRSNALYPPTTNFQSLQSQSPKLEIKQEPIAVVSYHQNCVSLIKLKNCFPYSIYVMLRNIRTIVSEEGRILTILMQQLKKMARMLMYSGDKEMIHLNQDLCSPVRVFNHPIKI